MLASDGDIVGPARAGAASETRCRDKHVMILAKGIYPETGGIETYSEQIARAYSSFGYPVTVISCFEGKPGSTRRGDMEVLNVGKGSQVVVAYRMWRAVRLWRHISGIPALVHATTWRVSIPALLVFPGIPLLITIHGREVTETQGLLARVMRYCFKAATKAVAVSNTTLAAALAQLPSLSRNSMVSWNGVTTRTAQERVQTPGDSLRDGPCRILTVCRLVPRKNVSNALRALSILRQRNCDFWKYNVVGEGPERNDLARETEALELTDAVRFLGHVSETDLEEQYRSADIFLHPQISGHDGRDMEGFGLAIADAMVYGLPVVVGRDGAPREFVSSGVTGFVVDGKSPEQIADTLAQLIEDRARREAIGEAARAWAAANLTWTSHVERILCDTTVRRSIDAG